MEHVTTEVYIYTCKLKYLYKKKKIKNTTQVSMVH